MFTTDMCENATPHCPNRPKLETSCSRTHTYILVDHTVERKCSHGHEYTDPLGSLPDKPVPQERDMEHVTGFAPYKPRPWRSFPWTSTHTAPPRAPSGEAGTHSAAGGPPLSPRRPSHSLPGTGTAPSRPSAGGTRGGHGVQEDERGGAAGHRKGCLEPGPSTQEEA